LPEDKSLALLPLAAMGQVRLDPLLRAIYT
jgi:hypothetical protein